MKPKKLTIFLITLYVYYAWRKNIEKKSEIVACILINIWGYMEFLPNEKCTNRRNKVCGLIEVKFVNTRVLLGLFIKLCKFTRPVSFDPFVSLRRSFQQQNLRGEEFSPARA